MAIGLVVGWAWRRIVIGHGNWLFPVIMCDASCKKVKIAVDGG